MTSAAMAAEDPAVSGAAAVLADRAAEEGAAAPEAADVRPQGLLPIKKTINLKGQINE